MTASKKEEQNPTKGWGFLAAMRYLERRGGKQPRIGESDRVSQDIAELGQDPYLGFADTELSQIDITAKPPKVRPRFLGFFGPFGPLPSSITREADRWTKHGDTSFVRFTDIFVARFQQLFYRSWSDARAITQYDHPSGGMFPRYLRSLTGDAPLAHDNRGEVDDVVRLRYTALGSGRVRSSIKLRQMLSAHFSTTIRVEEFARAWLEFTPEDRSAMGVQGMSLGRDTRLGSRAPSICEKIVVHVECDTLEEYRSFLPGRSRQSELRDLVLGYTGGFFEVDVALWLARSKIGAAQIGTSTELGWTSALPTDGKTKGICEDLVRACQYKIELQQTLH